MDRYLENIRTIGNSGGDLEKIATPLGMALIDKAEALFDQKNDAFTKDLLEGKEIRLEFDKEKRGKYGRLLAYVFLLDGTFVNAEIIKEGYGFAYTKYTFKYKDKFLALEREAQNNNLGYWKYGGKGEIDWIIEKGQYPFEVFQMSQKLL